MTSSQLQTKTHDGVQHKDANYIMAILDSRKRFVAHERFQYVLLKKFGESDIPVRFSPLPSAPLKREKGKETFAS